LKSGIAPFAEDCFGYLGVLRLHVSFRTDFPISVKDAIGILTGTALNAVDGF
jgi:hypothetical protein